jgi:maltooligosyltrehalose trehalohydrolase
VLTSPFTPMLFMGEEWGATTPWQYFTDHPEPDLAHAVRAGRRREFAEHGWMADDVPDPQDPATFSRSKLDWCEHAVEAHIEVLAWHIQLLALRRAQPELSDPRLDLVDVEVDPSARWVVVHRGTVRVVCNLADAAQEVPLKGDADVVLASGDARSTGSGLSLGAESVAIVRVSE